MPNGTLTSATAGTGIGTTFYKTPGPAINFPSRTDRNPKNDVLADSLPWPELLMKPNSLQKSLFGNLADQQRRIIAALYPSYDDKQHSLALRMSQCGASARVYIDPATGKVRPWMSLCRSRMCPYCGKGRAAKIQKSLYHLICRMKQPKHLTLTYRSNDEPLALQLKHLKKAFRQLRGTVDWKRNVKGGVFTVEVTRNVKTGKWHPHLHIVIDSNYIPQKRIVFLWSKYMPDGKNVWIRPVDNANGMGWEMAKYIGKAPTTRDWTVGDIREYQEASSHARFVQCFGCFSKYKLNVKYEKPEDAPRTYYVSIRRIANLARQGIPVAIDLAVLIRRRWPLFQKFIDHELPKLPSRTIQERKRVAFDIAKNDGLPPPETGPPTKEALEKLDFHLFTVFTRFNILDEQQAFLYEDNYEAA